MAYKPKGTRSPRNNRLPKEPRSPIPLEAVQTPPAATSPADAIDSISSEPSDEVLDVVVEAHAPASGSLKDKFLDKLRDITSGDNDEAEPAQPSKYSSYNSKKKQRSEVSNLLLTVFVIAAAAWPVPDEVKPVKDEMALVAEHLTSILARHNLLLGKLSGDALDVVGIIAAGAAWYTRVAPELRRLRGNGNDGGGGRATSAPTRPEPPSGAQTLDNPTTSPITRADAATGQWLEDVLQSSNTRSE